MDLVVIRHAIAGDRETFAQTGEDDSKRPLTDQGRQKMKEVALGIKRVVPQMDQIGTSPYRRAVQTAKIVARVCDGPKPERVQALAPDGQREDVLLWLEEQGEAETVVLVGHEPSLGLLVSWLLASPLNHFVELKKGGACMLHWASAPSAGTGWLRWLMPPDSLRRLARKTP